MYKFVSKEEIKAVYDSWKEVEAKEEALNKMRRDISEYLSKKLKEAQNNDLVSLGDKTLEIPEFFYNEQLEWHEFPNEIVAELNRVGLAPCLTKNSQGNCVYILA